MGAGFYGGWLDAGLSWVTEVLLAFPGILLALVIVTILGPGTRNVIIAVGIGFVPSFMRLTRGTVFAVREADYVSAARATGVPNGRIMRRHILPNIASPLLVLATIGIGGAILEGAALSFLGMGVQPPDPEWGAMLSGAAAVHPPRLVDRPLPRRGHLHLRAGHQPDRRRPERRHGTGER